MKRRTFLGTALAFAAGSRLLAALRRGRWDDAAEVLERATAEGMTIEGVRLTAKDGGKSGVYRAGERPGGG